MKTYSDLKIAVKKLEKSRKKLSLRVDPLSSLLTQKKWQNADKRGVYAIFNDNDELLYIGKASMNSSIGMRLGAKYYSKSRKAKYEGFAVGTKIATIQLPDDLAFEASSIEEYLIGILQPKLNKIGK